MKKKRRSKVGKQQAADKRAIRNLGKLFAKLAHDPKTRAAIKKALAHG